MMVVKKLVFAPLFLISLIWLFYQFTPFIKSADLIFSFSLETLLTLILICLSVLLTGLFFVIFTALAQDWKIVIPIILLSSLAPFIFLPQALALVSTVTILASLIISFMVLEGKMKSYLTFAPTALLAPSIKQLTGFLIIGLSLVYYLSINGEIQKNGFQIPDSLIDTALKFAPQTPQNFQGFKYDKRTVAQLPQITPEQLELLKKNPDLLKQYNIDPKMLDSLSGNSTSTSTSKSPANTNNLNDVIKKTIKDQVQNMLKPYQQFIPPILALLFFFTLQSFEAILSIFLSPVIWLIFIVLEKTKFITFTTEMREVKKMVV